MSSLIFVLVTAALTGIVAVDGCKNNTQCEPYEYCDHQLYLCFDCSEACDPEYEGFAIHCHTVCHDWCLELVNETSGLNNGEARSKYPLCWDQPKVHGSTTTPHPTDASCSPDDEDCDPGDSGSGTDSGDEVGPESSSNTPETAGNVVKTAIPAYDVLRNDTTTPTPSASASSKAWPVAYTLAGICGLLVIVAIVQGLYIFKQRHRLRRSRHLTDNDDDVEGDPEGRRMISIERRGSQDDSQL